MVYPYDNPEQWRAGFPAGWDPQQVLMQALKMQPGGPPVMPQAIRGGVAGQASATDGGYVPSSLTQGAPPQMAMAPQGGGAPAPAYYGPTHQALSTALQNSLTQQAQTPGLLSEQMQHGNWPTWQEKGGLYNNLYAPVHGYSRVDWLPDSPTANAQAQMLAQAQENNVRYGTPIPAGLEQQVIARQQAALAAPAPAPAAPQQAMSPEMQAYLLAQYQAAQNGYTTPWMDLSGGDGSAGGGAGAASDSGGDGTGGGTGGTY